MSKKIKTDSTAKTALAVTINTTGRLPQCLVGDVAASRRLVDLRVSKERNMARLVPA